MGLPGNNIDERDVNDPRGSAGGNKSTENTVVSGGYIRSIISTSELGWECGPNVGDNKVRCVFWPDFRRDVGQDHRFAVTVSATATRTRTT